MFNEHPISILFFDFLNDRQKNEKNIFIHQKESVFLQSKIDHYTLFVTRIVKI